MTRAFKFGGVSSWGVAGLALLLPVWLGLAAEPEKPKDDPADEINALVVDVLDAADGLPSGVKRKRDLLAKADEKAGNPPAKKQDPKILLRELKSKFPVESLAGRLDALTGKPVRKTDPKLRVKPDERAQFEGFHSRAGILKALHEESVEQFVGAFGFGLERMERLTVPPLAIRDSQVSFDPASSLSSSDYTERIELPKEGGIKAGPAPHWPSLSTLTEFHVRGQSQFLSPANFGFVKDREHVVGFVPHTFKSLPPVDFRSDRAIEGPERWKVQRLELVSLLKEEKPAVYVSDHLPNMRNLNGVERRSLTTFEDEALPKLRKGEELTAEASTNRIVLLGAIRATQQCLKCHDVERGDLLGAFSYELHRSPPVKSAE